MVVVFLYVDTTGADDELEIIVVVFLEYGGMDVVRSAVILGDVLL